MNKLFDLWVCWENIWLRVLAIPHSFQSIRLSTTPHVTSCKQLRIFATPLAYSTTRLGWEWVWLGMFPPYTHTHFGLTTGNLARVQICSCYSQAWERTTPFTWKKQSHRWLSLLTVWCLDHHLLSTASRLYITLQSPWQSLGLQSLGPTIYLAQPTLVGYRMCTCWCEQPKTPNHCSSCGKCVIGWSKGGGQSYWYPSYATPISC